MPALTIFRIKKGITDPAKVIADRDDPLLKHFNVKQGRYRIGDLYIRRKRTLRPSWAGYLDGAIDWDGFSLSTASLSAILLVKEGEHLFAVVFGYGRALLEEETIDERFGLRATLNGVEPSRLRSIDHKRLEAISRHTREQLSKEGNLAEFGLDIERDLLSAVTGVPTDKNYGKRLSGADQLVVTADVPLAKLQAALKSYGALADQDVYKTNFPWVEKIQDIHDPVLEAKLTKQLADELANGLAKAWMAPPDIIDWTKTKGFKYRDSKKVETENDLSLEAYFDACGAAVDLQNGERLRQDRVYRISSESEIAVESWSAIKCIVAEVQRDNDRFVLSEGTWYRLSSDYLSEVESFLSTIPITKIDLPDHKKGEREGAYNERAWKRDKGNLSLLDQKFIQYPRRGKVEVCDLFTTSRKMVHVKKMSGSSTLSHLFAQGTVAAELLRDHEDFRKQFLAKIPGRGWGSPKDQVDPQQFEVSFAIICKKADPTQIPFFSKVSLRAAVQRLRDLRFNVSWIGVATP